MNIERLFEEATTYGMDVDDMFAKAIEVKLETWEEVVNTIIEEVIRRFRVMQLSDIADYWQGNLDAEPQTYSESMSEEFGENL